MRLKLFRSRRSVIAQAAYSIAEFRVRLEFRSVCLSVRNDCEFRKKRLTRSRCRFGLIGQMGQENQSFQIPRGRNGYFCEIDGVAQSNV